MFVICRYSCHSTPNIPNGDCFHHSTPAHGYLLEQLRSQLLPSPVTHHWLGGAVAGWWWWCSGDGVWNSESPLQAHSDASFIHLLTHSLIRPTRPSTCFQSPHAPQTNRQPDSRAYCTEGRTTEKIFVFDQWMLMKFSFKPDKSPHTISCSVGRQLLLLGPHPNRHNH